MCVPTAILISLYPIPGLDISIAYHPAQEVGGDFYQILPLPVTAANAQSETLIVIGDVAGKGLAAAMTVSMLVGALDRLSKRRGHREKSSPVSTVA